MDTVKQKLEESKECYRLFNLAKSRAALTTARITANSMYTPPKTQAALDLQSGILHAADERDFKTAFSYFFEAFEGFDSIGYASEAVRSLKYMLLSKIMMDRPRDIAALLTHKHAEKYTGRDLNAMKAVADAAKNRSLADFKQAFEAYNNELRGDPVVSKNLKSLSDSMLEKDLSRIVEPYSYVQISYIAEAIKLDQETVEKKLTQMILDKKLLGCVHQGDGMLIVYDFESPSPIYKNAVDTIQSMSEVVDELFSCSEKLHKSS